MLLFAFGRPPTSVTDQVYYNVDGYGFTWYSEARAQFNPLSDTETDALRKALKRGPAGILSTEARIKDGPLLPFVKGPHPAMYKTISAQP